MMYVIATAVALLTAVASAETVGISYAQKVAEMRDDLDLEWHKQVPYHAPVYTSNSAPLDATCLVQDDFEDGTYIIDKPGDYKLCQDVTFSPLRPPPGQKLPEDACDPVFPSIYNENAFGLGFFAAIAITAPNVTLHLNGYTIEQATDHALLQRFFAVIELAESPFIKNAGPADFMGVNNTNFTAATNVAILGPGTIGLSSHHGVHGNFNKNVTIRDVTFRDYEVAAVSLNKVDGLLIEDCKVLRNRHDVPVLGSFSAARFLRPYGKYLKMQNYTMKLRGKRTPAATLYEKLLTTIENVFADVIDFGFIDKAAHPDEFELFDNPFGAIEGPCYAFLVHGKGPAVGDQGDVFDEDPELVSSNIIIRNNDIQHIKCWADEIPAAVENNTVMNDARGSVFQFTRSVDNKLLSIHKNGTYKGNVVADMQIMVANAILDGTLPNNPLHQTGTNTLNRTIIEWAKSGDTPYYPKYRCNGDSMHHVHKGMIIIRVENTQGVLIEDNKIEFIDNLSPPFFDNCTDYHAGTSDENANEQQGGNIRAISVAAIRGYGSGDQSIIRNNLIESMTSKNANVIVGIDVQGDSSQVQVSKNIINLDPAQKQDLADQEKLLAIRVRENAYNIQVDQNFVFQDIRILNNDNDDDPHKRRALHRVTSPGNSEYNLGGCPFARMGF